MRVSPELAATLIRPHLPDEAVRLGVSAARADAVRAAARARTSVPLSREQVYAGVGWLRANPAQGQLPLLTEPGAAGGYVFGLDPQRVQRGLRPKLLDLYTRMFRINRGIIVPYADLVLQPIDPVEADALRDDFRTGLAAVGRHV